MGHYGEAFYHKNLQNSSGLLYYSWQPKYNLTNISTMEIILKIYLSAFKGPSSAKVPTMNGGLQQPMGSGSVNRILQLDNYKCHFLTLCFGKIMFIRDIEN